MNYRLLIINLVCLIAVSVFAGLFWGCSRQQQDYKAQSDEKVYKIIDQKWDESLGSKANYKINDTEPLPGDIQIAQAVPESGILTLAQAVSLATAQTRVYQLEKENLYIKALDLNLARHEFENQFFGFGRSRFAYEDNVSEIENKADAGFGRLLTSGARISSRITSAWLTMLSGDFRTGLTSILRTEIAQPLLRGSEREIIMENLTQAERDTLYQIRTFNRFRKTFVVDVITRYYRVLQKYDSLENAKQNYRALAKLGERMKTLAEVGRLEDYESREAYQDRLDALDLYVKAKKEYQQGLDEFKVFLSLPATLELQLDTNELALLNLPGTSELDFSEEESIKTGLEQRLDIANSADAIEDAKRKVNVAADGFKPGLDIVVDTRVSVLDTGVSNTSRDDRVRGGFELDLNIDKELEKNIYRKALIFLNQRNREHAEARDMVGLEVRRAYRNMAEAAELYEVQSEGLLLAQKRSEDTFEMLNYQRANTRDVLDAQKDLFRVRNAATASLVDYTIAMLDFYRDAGVLEVRPDGMWQEGENTAKAAVQPDLNAIEDFSIPESEHEQTASEVFIKQWVNKAGRKTP